MENNTNTTTKPIIIAMNDFKQNIVKAINDSQMPMAIVNMLLKDIIMQCDQLEKQELEVTMQQYNKQQTESEDKNEN
ncbi:hypothetical protein [Jutongia sp.]|uniref:hypothetical protein n=1 Tax=Jutongia sp. TaxID=2944204 RepID=UPI0030808EC1